jgi:asparaginyl-tRNA synthetase
VKSEVGDEKFALCDHVPQESSVTVTGTVRADERSPGGVEIGLKDIRVVAESAPNYPIQIQDVSPEVGFLMQNRHLWLRSRKQAALLRVRAEVIRSIRDFFDSRGFICVDSPILTPAACEGTSTLFPVDYFEDKAFLTQSGQLYAEAAAMALGRVYCFGPTFRAEKSKTRKHLTEFWMVEPEVAFLELDGLMELAEQFISSIVARCLDRRKEELKVLGRDTSKLEKVVPPFHRLHYNDAVKKVNAAGVEMTWGDDFGAPQEEAVAAGFDRPVMVHRYPAEIKAFYMQPDPADPKHALCVDVIAPDGYGELIGGSQRIHDYALLEERLKQNKLPREPFEWYLDLRKYGTVPHSGFGLGVERTVAWIAGTEHIRECIPFPRMLYKIYP